MGFALGRESLGGRCHRECVGRRRVIGEVLGTDGGDGIRDNGGWRLSAGGVLRLALGHAVGRGVGFDVSMAEEVSDIGVVEAGGGVFGPPSLDEFRSRDMGVLAGPGLRAARSAASLPDSPRSASQSRIC